MRCLNSFNGCNVSKSLIRFPLRFKFCNFGLLCSKFNPFEIRLSLNSSLCKFGNFGKPFSDVKPTFIRLNTRKFVKSSVRPTILVLRQLSRFNSSTWKRNMFLKNYAYAGENFRIARNESYGFLQRRRGNTSATPAGMWGTRL